MIAIAVLTADKKSAVLIRKYIKLLEDEKAGPFSVNIYGNVIDFFAEYKTGFDIAVIDTMLPGMTGMQVAELIRGNGNEMPIIFISSTAKSAVNAFAYDVSAYLLKPISESEFCRAMLSVVKKLDKRMGGQFIIRADGTFVLMDARTLYSVRVEGHYLYYYSEKGEYVSRGTMNECESRLRPYGFLRCNNSVLINMLYVTSLSSAEVTVAGKKYRVSHSRYNALKERFTKR